MNNEYEYVIKFLRNFFTICHLYFINVIVLSPFSLAPIKILKKINKHCKRWHNDAVQELHFSLHHFFVGLCSSVCIETTNRRPRTRQFR